MTSIIHFVGLIVIMSQPVAPNITLRAVARDTPHVETQLVAVAPRVNVVLPPQSPQTNNLVLSTVERHSTILAFRACDLRSASGWDIKQLHDEPDFLYVELNGERVTFQVNGVNPTADIHDLQWLPHIGIDKTMKADYRPSSSRIAATFEIPKGKLHTCRGRADRRDTELRLANSGPLTIKAGSKTLVFAGSAAIVAANIPTSALNGQKPSVGEWVPHYAVWCDMNGTLGHCMPPAAAACPDGSTQDECLPCDSPAFAISGATPQFPAFFTSFECSNTQWP